MWNLFSRFSIAQSLWNHTREAESKIERSAFFLLFLCFSSFTVHSCSRIRGSFLCKREREGEREIVEWKFRNSFIFSLSLPPSLSILLFRKAPKGTVAKRCSFRLLKSREKNQRQKTGSKKERKNKTQKEGKKTRKEKEIFCFHFTSKLFFFSFDSLICCCFCFSFLCLKNKKFLCFFNINKIFSPFHSSSLSLLSNFYITSNIQSEERKQERKESWTNKTICRNMRCHFCSSTLLLYCNK